MNDTINIDRRTLILGVLSLPLIASSAPSEVKNRASVLADKMNKSSLTNAFLADAMIVIKREGSADRERSIQIASLKKEGENISLRRYVFNTPSDIKGTKLLVHEKIKGNNSVWLLLPAVGRPRRLSASKQSGYFAGTDFSYADLSALQVDEYEHAIYAEDDTKISVESTVKTKEYARSIGYSKIITVMDAQTCVPSEAQYFDLKGQKVKTQIMGDPVKSPDGKTILKDRRMIVHKNNRETVLSIADIDFDPSLSKNDFAAQRL